MTMTISIALIVMLAQTPYQPPYQDLIDDSKVPKTDAGDVSVSSYTTTMKQYGYEINETGIIAALHDQQDAAVLIRQAATMLLRESNQLKVNLRTPGVASALQDAFNDAVRDNNQWAVTNMAGTLLSMGKKDWIHDAVDILPRMSNRLDRIFLARTLAVAGRSDGWPSVRDEIASNDADRIYSALGVVDKFDGLSSPMAGGQPIDVAKELHQLTATTPDTVQWPTFNMPGLRKQRSKDHIEAKAAQMDKAKAQKRQ